MRSTILALASMAAVFTAAPAAADIIMYEDPSSLQPSENLLLNANQIGTLIFGNTNLTHTAFTAEGNETLVSQPQGQAKITAQDGSFNFLAIYATDPTLRFTEIEFNLNSLADGNVTLTFFDGGLNPTDTFSLDASGENFFSAEAINGQTMSRVEISSDVGLEDIRQIRIGGVTGPDGPIPLPEPAMLGLLGLGLAGVAFARRRK